MFAAGVTTYTCATCGYSYTEAIAQLTSGVTTIGAQALTGTWDAIRFGATLNVAKLKASAEAGDNISYGYLVQNKAVMNDNDLLGTNDGVAYLTIGFLVDIPWLEEYETMTTAQLVAAWRALGCKIYSYNATSITFVGAIRGMTNENTQVVFRPALEIGDNTAFGTQYYNSIATLRAFYEGTSASGASTMFPTVQ